MIYKIVTILRKNINSFSKKCLSPQGKKYTFPQKNPVPSLVFVYFFKKSCQSWAAATMNMQSVVQFETKPVSSKIANFQESWARKLSTWNFHESLLVSWKFRSKPKWASDKKSHTRKVTSENFTWSFMKGVRESEFSLENQSSHLFMTFSLYFSSFVRNLTKKYFIVTFVRSNTADEIHQQKNGWIFMKFKFMKFHHEISWWNFITAMPPSRPKNKMGKTVPY